MKILTPPLSVKSVSVVPMLFKAQLPDTLNAIRQAIPEWSAVHVTADVGSIKRGSTPDEIKKELLAQLKNVAVPFEPIYTLTTPGIPPGTIITLVPDRLRPKFAPEYEGWKFIYYQESRTLLDEFFERALGGMPEGAVTVGEALIKGKIKGQTALEGWSGTIGVPSFKRTLEAVLDPKGAVVFWDGAFGYEADGARLLNSLDFVLGLFAAKGDRLYFDAQDWAWFVLVEAGGTVKVGLLG
jgi:hypothetical protein